MTPDVSAFDSSVECHVGGLCGRGTLPPAGDEKTALTASAGSAITTNVTQLYGHGQACSAQSSHSQLACGANFRLLLGFIEIAAVGPRDAYRICSVCPVSICRQKRRNAEQSET